MDNLIAFAKSLSIGPCTCQYNMGSMGISWDQVTGEQTHHYDRGPRTLHCLRCRAREALDADCIEYEKDDGTYGGLTVALALGARVPIDTACKTFLGEVTTFVLSGSR